VDSSPEKNSTSTIRQDLEFDDTNKQHLNDHQVLLKSTNHSINQSSYLESDSMLVCGTEFVDIGANPEFILEDILLDPKLEKKFRDKQNRKTVNKNLESEFDQPIQESDAEYLQSSTKKNKDLNQQSNTTREANTGSNLKGKKIVFTPSNEILQARRKERFVERENNQNNSDSFNSINSNEYVNLKNFET
jgi:hypothetical protein